MRPLRDRMAFALIFCLMAVIGAAPAVSASAPPAPTARGLPTEKQCAADYQPLNVTDGPSGYRAQARLCLRTDGVKVTLHAEAKCTYAGGIFSTQGCDVSDLSGSLTRNGETLSERTVDDELRYAGPGPYRVTALVDVHSWNESEKGSRADGYFKSEISSTIELTSDRLEAARLVLTAEPASPTAGIDETRKITLTLRNDGDGTASDASLAITHSGTTPPVVQDARCTQGLCRLGDIDAGEMTQVTVLARNDGCGSHVVLWGARYREHDESKRQEGPQNTNWICPDIPLKVRFTPAPLPWSDTDKDPATARDWDARITRDDSALQNPDEWIKSGVPVTVSITNVGNQGTYRGSFRACQGTLPESDTCAPDRRDYVWCHRVTCWPSDIEKGTEPRPYFRYLGQENLSIAAGDTESFTLKVPTGDRCTKGLAFVYQLVRWGSLTVPSVSTKITNGPDWKCPSTTGG
ncbi:hypothetical protein RB200_06840 [Streptomyces sp. PmtG]